MSPANPPLSERPGFIPCKPGERLTEAQYRLVFAGSDRFFQRLAQVAAAELAALPAPTPAVEPEAVAS